MAYPGDGATAQEALCAVPSPRQVIRAESSENTHLAEHAEVRAGILGDTISAQAAKEKGPSES